MPRVGVAGAGPGTGIELIAPATRIVGLAAWEQRHDAVSDADRCPFDAAPPIGQNGIHDSPSRGIEFVMLHGPAVAGTGERAKTVAR